MNQPRVYSQGVIYCHDFVSFLPVFTDSVQMGTLIIRSSAKARICGRLTAINIAAANTAATAVNLFHFFFEIFTFDDGY